jgi:gamma-glutamyl phosphate reductase
MKESPVDRVSPAEARIDGGIESIGTIIRLDDPIGRVKAGWKTPEVNLVRRCEKSTTGIFPVIMTAATRVDTF